jgi:GT2 family glycosyltransferase
MTERLVTSSPAPVAIVPPTDAPHVSFVAVAYGTGPIIVDSIRSLVASLAHTGIEYEYVVVDNEHPTSPWRAHHELVLGTAGVTVVTPGRNVGFGGGCELGALHARAEVIAFVNPDVIYPDGWLAPLLAALGTGPAHDGPGLVVPVLLDPDGTVQEAGQQVRADGSTRPLTAPPADVGTGDADYASAACWIVRRRELERIGGFDPAFHPAYYEDVDLLLRLRSLGGHWAIVPDATVVHHRGSSTADRHMPDIRPQRAELLARWPEIRWTRPA